MNPEIQKRVKKGELIRIWDHADSPVLWVYLLFLADTVKMPEYFGLTYGEHYFLSVHQKTTFYLNAASEINAGKWGLRHFMRPAFVARYCKESTQAELQLKEFVIQLEKKKLTRENTQQIVMKVKQFCELYADLFAYYRLSRAEFYEPLIKKDPIHFKKLEIVGKRRLAMHHTWMNTWRKAAPLFSEVGRRVGVRAIDITNCTREEIIAALRTGHLSEDVRKRKEGFEFIYKGSRCVVNSCIPDFSPDLKINKVKGIPAYRGVVSGTVIIVEESLKGVRVSEKDFSEDSILVTQMTSPDMLPLMKRVCAFVTDDGGLLCHAAIVARELKKPCIIGTKIATKVLKDGDFVEVDADKGIVRILPDKGDARLGYKDIDWAHYLSRPKEFFLTNILVKDFKGTRLKEILGFGHDYWLFLYNGGGTVDLYRRVDELQASDAFMRVFIQDTVKIKELFAEARKVITQIEKVIAEYKSKRAKGSLKKQYKNAIRHIVEYFVYAVEIPYITGGILETENLTTDKEFKWVLKECKYFRGLSHYPDFYEHVLSPLTRQVRKELKVAEDEVEFVTADEIIDFLDGKATAEKLRQEARSRRKGFIGFSAFGKEQFVNDSAFLESFYPKVPENVKEIKGNIGYKGLVEGKVTVVITKADFEKFKEGNILVTIQSNPSFMPVIAKSSAIVADEGGIMSHAAIVSRELGIPCIIGTKIATKVLKDGDEVEVNATKGLIRIIKRVK